MKTTLKSDRYNLRAEERRIDSTRTFNRIVRDTERAAQRRLKRFYSEADYPARGGR